VKVIGCGFGRTGSMSMKLALEMLGVGPCHHMDEVIANPEKQLPYWLAAAKGESMDWDAALRGYNSCVDWPTAAYWPQLAAHYPDAKILLTTRSAESWYNSISKTIFKILGDIAAAPTQSPANPFGEMIQQMITNNTFKGDISDPEHCMEVFNANVQAVKDAFGGDRLFVYTIGDGWEGLCQWLEVPVPDTPFPRTNNQQEFFELSAKAPQ